VVEQLTSDPDAGTIRRGGGARSSGSARPSFRETARRTGRRIPASGGGRPQRRGDCGDYRQQLETTRAGCAMPAASCASCRGARVNEVPPDQEPDHTTGCIAAHRRKMTAAERDVRRRVLKHAAEIGCAASGQDSVGGRGPRAANRRWRGPATWARWPPPRSPAWWSSRDFSRRVRRPWQPWHQRRVAATGPHCRRRRNRGCRRRRPRRGPQPRGDRGENGSGAKSRGGEVAATPPAWRGAAIVRWPRGRGGAAIGSGCGTAARR